MPAAASPRTPGRPKEHVEPRRSTSFRLDHDNLTWMDENLPRSAKLNVFINEAIREKIAREKRKK